MVRTLKAEMGDPTGDVHEIELDGITRDFDVGFQSDVYTVDFATDSPEGNTKASVEVMSAEATTTEIVPTAMGRLHILFATLAKQTEAWVKGKA